MNFDSDFDEVLSAFAKAAVDFMIVGGAAVNFHGFDRNTSDLDLWINPVEENKQKIYSALVSMGYHVQDARFIMDIDFSIPQCIKLGEPPHTMDIMTHMVGLKYEEANALKIPFQTVNDYTVYFIHYSHLVINKMIAGRPKDKIDVEELQKIIQFKKP